MFALVLACTAPCLVFADNSSSNEAGRDLIPSGSLLADGQDAASAAPRSYAVDPRTISSQDELVAEPVVVSQAPSASAQAHVVANENGVVSENAQAGSTESVLEDQAVQPSIQPSTDESALDEALGFFGMNVLASQAVAQGACGSNVFWQLDSSGELVVFGMGEMSSFAGTTAPWSSKASQINSVVIQSGVVSVGANAFAGLSGLTSVTIQSGVSSIASNAFQNCPNLAVVNLPVSVSTVGDGAFASCPKLSTVYYEGNWDSWFAFSNSLGYRTSSPCCNGANLYCAGSLVTAAVIPNDAYSVLGPVLSGVGSVKSVSIPYSVRAVSSIAFQDCPAMSSFGSCGSNTCYFLYPNGRLQITGAGKMASPASASDIAWSSRAAQVSSVDLSPDVTSIGNYAFENCSNVTSVTIPAGVTSIGRASFQGCSSLTDLVIPNAVTSVGDAAFGNCSSLRSVSLGSAISSMGVNVFAGCSAIQQVYFAGSSDQWIEFAQTFSSEANNPCHSGATLNVNGSPLTSLVVPETTTSIPDYAFYGCNSLSNVSIPLSVQSVGASSFAGCPGVQMSGPFGNTSSFILLSDNTLQIMGSGNMSPAYNASDIPWAQKASSISQVSISPEVSSLSNYAFYGCSRLGQVNVPQGVVSLGDHCFDGCSSMSQLTIPSSIGSLGLYAFSNCRNLQRVYYDGSLSDWMGTVAYLYDPSSNPCYNGSALYVDGQLVENLAIPQGISSIPSYAFANVSSLKTATVPDSITSIGTGAFLNTPAFLMSGKCGNKACYFLHSDGTLQITGSGAMSNYNTGTNSSPWKNSSQKIVSRISLSPDLTSIGEYAFYRSLLVNSVSIPEGIESIGKYAFYGCSEMRGITLPSSLKSLGSRAFYGCGLRGIEIPDGVTSVADYCFFNCTSLSSVKLPASISSVATCTFYNCSSLETIDIPEGVTSIAANAFYNDTSLRKVALPRSLSSVSANAFASCRALKNVSYAGTEQNRKSISIGSGNTTLTTATWEYSSSAGTAPHVHSAASAITIPPTCTEQGYEMVYCECGAFIENKNYTEPLGHAWDEGVVTTPSAFGVEGVKTFTCTRNSSHVKTASIPALTSVSGGEGTNTTWTLNNAGKLVLSGHGAMSDPSGQWLQYRSTIKEVVVSEGVTSVSDSAFSECTNLSKVTLPASVTSIGKSSFEKCAGLTFVKFGGNAPTIATNSFAGCNKATMHYAATNLTWLPEKLTNYGGTLTWVADGADAFAAGDVNLDGSLNMTDLVMLKRYLGGALALSAVQIQKADFNGDGSVTKTDHDILGKQLTSK